MIKNFIQSDRSSLVFIVDGGISNQVTKKRKKLKENISHLRMMIEEAEDHPLMGVKKVFVMLIHFDPAELLNDQPCYPALFLQGWDHYYLDSIADGALTLRGNTASVVNTKQWLYCCLVKSKNAFGRDYNFDEISCNVEDILMLSLIHI